MDLTVTRAALTAMMGHAARDHAEECCGILLGDFGTIREARPAPNRAADPRYFFEIDPQTLVDAHRAARAGGPTVLGYYHSHPIGDPAPSAADQTMAARDGSVWAIVGQGMVTLWRDAPAGFEPLSYRVADG